MLSNWRLPIFFLFSILEANTLFLPTRVETLTADFNLEQTTVRDVPTNLNCESYTLLVSLDESSITNNGHTLSFDGETSDVSFNPSDDQSPFDTPTRLQINSFVI